MKTALSALARALATIREAEANGNTQNASDLRYYLQRQGYDIAVSSNARKICRAFDAADERESTEIGV